IWSVETSQTCPDDLIASPKVAGRHYASADGARDMAMDDARKSSRHRMSQETVTVGSLPSSPGRRRLAAAGWEEI
ncbi:hypothetical protein EVAR_25845_1, partial [Eumeta japonica]